MGARFVVSVLDIIPDIPPLPEGWEGTPDELLQFIKDNITFSIDQDTGGGGNTASGIGIAGQIGGARPTRDIGVFFDEFGVERYINGAYQPISDVPVGAMLPWPSTLAAPTNYLLCNGQSVSRTDYARLFAIIGTTWGAVDSNNFNLPDTRGRMPVGSGIGDYEKQGITGKLPTRAVGELIGTNWLNRKTVYPNAPTASMKFVPGTALNPAGGEWHDTGNPGFVTNWIIRYR